MGNDSNEVEMGKWRRASIASHCAIEWIEVVASSSSWRHWNWNWVPRLCAAAEREKESIAHFSSFCRFLSLSLSFSVILHPT